MPSGALRSCAVRSRVATPRTLAAAGRIPSLRRSGRACRPSRAGHPRAARARAWPRRSFWRSSRHALLADLQRSDGAEVALDDLAVLLRFEILLDHLAGAGEREVDGFTPK